MTFDKGLLVPNVSVTRLSRLSPVAPIAVNREDASEMKEDAPALPLQPPAPPLPVGVFPQISRQSSPSSPSAPVSEQEAAARPQLHDGDMSDEGSLSQAESVSGDEEEDFPDDICGEGRDDEPDDELLNVPWQPLLILMQWETIRLLHERRIHGPLIRTRKRLH